jgi:hypothetical protein
MLNTITYCSLSPDFTVHFGRNYAGHVKTNKFNALWIFSSLPQERLVKRHKRGAGHGILG